jgi:threonylcarbamoyladenosine tRNA methylthiotransferase MtaB
MSSARILTFGCRLNAFEAEILRRNAEAAGLEDAVIVNTCAVTAEAERQARQAIRRARRHRPEGRIVVTGCAAQIHPLSFARMPEVDLVLGNEEKLRPESFQNIVAVEEGARAPVLVADILKVRETAPHLVDGFAGRARAFVQIQQGCDHRCTFCIVPFARGPNRSIGASAVVEQVNALVARGYAEVVLTGVDLTSYGADLDGCPRLGSLVRRLLTEVPDLPRLRLSSLDPAAIDDELIALYADEPRLMPHIHLSVQSGDDLILKRMKRRHSRADVVDLCKRVRSLRSDTVFGADLIAGFPTETEAGFRSTLELIEDCGLVHLHVFPYSARPGTPASRMPMVDSALVKKRAALLREAGADARRRYFESRIGAVESVLIERVTPETGEGSGASSAYAPVAFTGRDGVALPPMGGIVRVCIDSASADGLKGRLVS